MKNLKTIGILVLAVVLVVSFTVFANAQDKSTVKKVAKKVEKAVKGDKAKCCSESTAKKCCDSAKKADAAKCCEGHAKMEKKSDCCAKGAGANKDCKGECDHHKGDKDKK